MFLDNLRTNGKDKISDAIIEINVTFKLALNTK
jgi:hypothetical protein